MTVSSVTWAPTVQWGGSAASVWADDTIDTPPALLGTGVVLDPVVGTLFAGYIWDANNDQSLSFATVGGIARILEPPILLALSITISATQAQTNNGSDNRIEVGVVPDASPANYSITAIPWSRGEVSLGTFTLGTLPVAGLDATEHTLVFSSDAVTSVRALVTSRGDWNGRLALSLRAVGAHAINLFNLIGRESSAITSQESLFFGGLIGGPSGPRARYVRDDRYGMPALNSELIRDGDNPGLWVRLWDQDPEDEAATYRPKPGEGTVDDEIGHN